MKKTILFVMNNLHCGGAEKSLISLLQSLDYTKYEVDLFLLKHEGIFLSSVPQEVNLLEEPRDYKYFDMPIQKAIYGCVKNKKYKMALSRLLAGGVYRIESNPFKCDQRVWKFSSTSIEKLSQKYDIAIGYLEMVPTYFVVEKVNATKKIGWIHTNYTSAGMDREFDTPYFKMLDHIITVSDECLNDLMVNFLDLSSKLFMIENIVSPPTIHRLSEIKKNDFDLEDGIVHIVTVARLSYVKGIDMAIKACRALLDRGIKVKWYVLGTGTEQETNEYKKQIEENNLKHSFYLLGVKENPYPYIKKANIYVQPSRFEGKSIAIEEAKILHRPIVVTNFSTVKDQITHEKTGLIVEMDAISIAKGIEKLINDVRLREMLEKNLANEELGTEKEIQKLYELIS